MLKMGVQNEVASLDAAEDVEGFEFKVYALGPGLGNYGFSCRFMTWLFKNMNNYDGVIVHGLWQFHGLAALLVSLWTGKKYSLFTHGMMDPWFKRQYPLKHLKKMPYWLLVQRHVIARARPVFFTCEREKELAREPFPFYRSVEQVVGYGTSKVEMGENPRELFWEAFPQCRGKKVILFLSRIHEKKGCDLLLEAFGRVYKNEEDVVLVMAGPDQVGWKAELEQVVEKHEMENRVIWTGMLGREMKHSALCCAEAMALPSHQENFGIVVAEALSHGVPVLISNQVNIYKEVLVSKAGWVEDDDLEGAIKLLEQWKSMSEVERQEMSVRAKRCFAEHFDIHQQVQLMLEHLT